MVTLPQLGGGGGFHELTGCLGPFFPLLVFLGHCLTLQLMEKAKKLMYYSHS